MAAAKTVANVILDHRLSSSLEQRSLRRPPQHRFTTADNLAKSRASTTSRSLRTCSVRTPWRRRATRTPSNSSTPTRTTSTCSRRSASETRALRRSGPGATGTSVPCASIYTVRSHFCCSRFAKIDVRATSSQHGHEDSTNNCYVVDTNENSRCVASGQQRACHVATPTRSTWRQRHDLTWPRRRAAVHGRPPRACTPPCIIPGKHHTNAGVVASSSIHIDDQ